MFNFIRRLQPENYKAMKERDELWDAYVQLDHELYVFMLENFCLARSMIEEIDNED